ncbi:cobalamin biosynthesis protein [Methylobacterium sp. J-076]|uniref:cobalamin biosynthesis protein n=1 Tax=Methylobacterium sp. J-076 TaxID=2836655 RepID=UPI001FBA40AA|nr:cobalamin biosynthesis protein [Methylobacterium sp. J-076]MCJ2013370.1 cobalamin biosynthesis protein [Methylobacterium sp. J-076]
MGLDQAVSARPGLVAGIGFRRHAQAAEIASLIRRALEEAEAGPADLAAIATAGDRAGEPAIREAAALFGLVPEGLSPEALAACDPQVRTRSARIEALRGVGSLCEAAALAAAGPAGRLALARIATGSVTCALAFRAETRERPEA